MDSEFITHVRMNAHQRSKLLCRLDESPGMGRAIERRRQARIEYRVPDIAVVVQHPGGGSGKFLVHARNISAGGLAFIHGGFVHPGSECQVDLTRRDGRSLKVAGLTAGSLKLSRKLRLRWPAGPPTTSPAGADSRFSTDRGEGEADRVAGDG